MPKDAHRWLSSSQKIGRLVSGRQIEGMKAGLAEICTALPAAVVEHMTLWSADLHRTSTHRLWTERVMISICVSKRLIVRQF